MTFILKKSSHKRKKKFGILLIFILKDFKQLLPSKPRAILHLIKARLGNPTPLNIFFKISLRVRFAIFSIFNRLRICNRKKYMSNFYWSLLRTYMTTK